MKNQIQKFKDKLGKTKDPLIIKALERKIEVLEGEKTVLK